jgi:hypothetical protein
MWAQESKDLLDPLALLAPQEAVLVNKDLLDLLDLPDPGGHRENADPPVLQENRVVIFVPELHLRMNPDSW